MQLFSFRNIRIIFLLVILAVAALYTKDQRLVTQGWYRPIDVVIYPINADNDPAITQYINNLKRKDFTAVEDFFVRESRRYQIIVDKPVALHLASELQQLPPAVPEPGSSTLEIMLWSLKMRWWAYRHGEIPEGLDSAYTIRTFLLLHNPIGQPRLRHSIGIQKGLVTIVHAFASDQYKNQNNIILTHELLHTFGATDKYSPTTNLPVFPDGFAEPDRKPLYPQRKAEIMAVKQALREDYAEIPKSLKKETVNERTAREIGWLVDENPD